MELNRLLFLTPLLLFLLSCASLTLEPPGPARQTVLVLPVAVVNDAQNSRYGFYYVYTIESLDGSVAPYQATIKLPLKGNMLLVDSLPPGDYAVKEFKFLTQGTGNFSYGKNTYARDDRFTLEAGKITLFEKSLNVRLFNKIPGHGMETSYQSKLDPVYTTQKLEIMATLGKLPGFDNWSMQNDLPTIVSDIQGEWIAILTPENKLDSNGWACTQETVFLEVDGSYLRGISETPGIYTTRAKVENIGSISGAFYTDPVYKGQFSGKYAAGKLSGTYNDPVKCAGKWAAERKQKPKKVKGEGMSGIYISTIRGNDLFGLTRAKNVEVILRQNGKQLLGEFGKGGYIEGEIEGEKITFEWDSPYGKGKGIWIVDASTNRLKGTWISTNYNANGTWDLKPAQDSGMD